MKAKRNKKYTPKPVHAFGGLTRIAMAHARGQEAAPLQPSQLTDLGVAYWLSMENLTKGAANEESWSCVVCALNIGLVMAERGIGAEYELDLVAALDGAFRAKVRSARTGSFRLDGDAIQAINHALKIHDAQMEVASRAQVTAAMEQVHARMAQGNIYREAA